MWRFIIQYLVPLWYVLWCRIYNFFENEYCGMIVVPLWSRKQVPNQAWGSFTSDIRYRHDDITMLWDVCSIPAATMLRKTGDCDDYARLAREYFGGSFNNGAKEFLFQGLYSLVYSKKPHHMVAVYKERNGLDHVSIAQEFEYHNDFAALLRYYENSTETAGKSRRFIEYCVVYDVSGWRLKRKTFIDCRGILR